MTKLPAVFIVAPMMRSPGCFSTGIDSPVTIDSSTALVPSVTLPSTGTFSPGLTRAGTQFQDLSEQHQRDNGCCRFEVDGDEAVHVAERTGEHARK